MKKVFFLFLILFQLVLIIFLYTYVLKKQASKKITIAEIDKNIINVKGTRSLKYYYELGPNIIKTIKPDWLDKAATYTFNNDGLNERFDYATLKSVNTYRIIALGDSITFGQYVNTKDNWTELIEDKLNNFNCKNNYKFEVINLGVPGYDIQYEVERFREKGKKYNPDLVLWMLFDSTRIMEELRPLIDTCQKNHPELVENKDKEIPKYYCWLRAKKELMNKKSDYIEKFLIEKFSEIFTVYNKQIVAIDLNKSHQKILNVVNRLNKIHVFGYDFINSELKLPDGHPNQAGHQKIAEDVFNYLMKNKIIPCD